MPITVTARSQDSRLLDDAIRSIVMKEKDFGVPVFGPFPVPTKNSRDSKDSNRRTCIHSRVFQLKDTTPKFMEALYGMKISENINFSITQA